MGKILTTKTKLIAKLHHSLKGKSLPKLARDIGISQPTLWRLMHGESEGTDTTWGKIEKYYRSRNGKG